MSHFNAQPGRMSLAQYSAAPAGGAFVANHPPAAGPFTFWCAWWRICARPGKSDYMFWQHPRQRTDPHHCFRRYRVLLRRRSMCPSIHLGRRLSRLRRGCARGETAARRAIGSMSGTRSHTNIMRTLVSKTPSTRSTNRARPCAVATGTAEQTFKPQCCCCVPQMWSRSMSRQPVLPTSRFSNL